jgi:CheY-like chemotaxis protein
MIPSILVIDDDPAVRDAVRFLLELEGYNVQAVTAPVALAMVDRERPDLVLLDLDMPVVDGLEVRSSLLADPTTADIPVVAMAEAAKLTQHWPTLQVQGALVKPLSYEALMTEVARLI